MTLTKDISYYYFVNAIQHGNHALESLEIYCKPSKEKEGRQAILLLLSPISVFYLQLTHLHLIQRGVEMLMVASFGLHKPG